MRILIAYDGSRCSGAALDDLVKAGLPRDAEALIITVAERWLPPSLGAADRETPAGLDGNEEDLLAEAHTLVTYAAKRLEIMFPHWKLEVEVGFGSPASKILEVAERSDRDLTVVGSHGRTGFDRSMLGSISQRVLAESLCSVRIARGRVEVDPAPIRLLLGFDGSDGSMLALDEITSRHWPSSTEAIIVAAMNSVLPEAVGRFLPPVADRQDASLDPAEEQLRLIGHGALKTLNAAGVASKFEARPGNPKQILVNRALEWNADTIFLGATDDASLGTTRSSLGSTAGAIAERAPCSVEIVRKRNLK